MTLLEALQLIGYSLGAVLPLWMGYLLLKQRLGLVPIQRLLLSLGWCMAAWHASNLVITLRSLLGLDVARWAGVLRLASSIAVISITVCYSLLLHVHLHLWAGAQGRSLTRTERVRVYLSYIPCLFLIITVPRIWIGPYQPMVVGSEVQILPSCARIEHMGGPRRPRVDADLIALGYDDVRDHVEGARQRQRGDGFARLDTPDPLAQLRPGGVVDV